MSQPVPAARPEVTHHFTVDVEDYFHVNAFERAIPRDTWTSIPRRLDENVARLLDLLARHHVRGTFFTLGWVAEHMPEVVRRIARSGHEVASHGYWHRRVPTMSPTGFREDVRMSRAALENLTGIPVRGFRAPSFSLLAGAASWAYQVLVEEGFTYDSSVFPIWRPGYGNPRAPRSAYTVTTPSGALREFPLATMSVAGVRIPAAGGGYLRQLPLAVTQGALRQASSAGIPATFYIHPWEIDAAQPRVAVNVVTRLRHYRGLSRTSSRLETLLGEFRFGAIAASLDASTDDAARSVPA